MTDEQVVRTDGIAVSKSFDAEGFPVPAVTFSIESGREDPVSLQITETVPSQFDIDQIGFHPDYGSDNWTARSDGTLRFERVLDPGETFTTVYGIRMEDRTDPAPLLSEPAVDVELSPAKQASESGSKEKTSAPSNPSSQEVESASATHEHDLPDDDAEIIGGSFPKRGNERGDASETENRSDTDRDDVQEPAKPDTEGRSAETESDQRGSHPNRASEDLYSTSTGAEEASGPQSSDPADDDDSPTVAEAVAKSSGSGSDGSESDPNPVSAESSGNDSETESNLEIESNPGNESNSGTNSNAETESNAEIESDSATLVERLREEIESGSVPEDERTALADALFGDHTDRVESTDRAGSGRPDQVRFEHLQSRVSALEAYTDALEDFIEMAGTSDDIREVIASEITDLQSTVKSLAANYDDLDGEHEELVDTVSDLESTQETLDATVEDLETSQEGLESEQSDLEENYDDLEAELDGLEKTQETLGGDIERLESAHETMAETVGDVESELNALDAGQTALDDAHDSLTADVSDLDTELETVKSTVKELDDSVEAVESTVQGLESDVASIDEELQTAESEREALVARANEIESTVESVAEKTDAIERIRGDLDALDERVADVDEIHLTVTELTRKFEDLEGDIERIKAVSDQLSEAF